MQNTTSWSNLSIRVFQDIHDSPFIVVNTNVSHMLTGDTLDCYGLCNINFTLHLLSVIASVTLWPKLIFFNQGFLGCTVSLLVLPGSLIWHMFVLFEFNYSLAQSLLQEPDEIDEVNDDKRASLLKMNFSVKDVDFAIQKLGMYL